MTRRLLFDQNLAPRLVGRVAAAFPGSLHVRDLDLQVATDAEVLRVALERDLVIVTKDKDFADIVTTRANGPKVLWLMLGNVATSHARFVMTSEAAEVANLHAEAGRAGRARLVAQVRGVGRRVLHRVGDDCARRMAFVKGDLDGAVDMAMRGFLDAAYEAHCRPYGVRPPLDVEDWLGLGSVVQEMRAAVGSGAFEHETRLGASMTSDRVLEFLADEAVPRFKARPGAAQSAPAS